MKHILMLILQNFWVTGGISCGDTRMRVDGEDSDTSQQLDSITASFPLPHPWKSLKSADYQMGPQVKFLHTPWVCIAAPFGARMTSKIVSVRFLVPSSILLLLPEK